MFSKIKSVGLFGLNAFPVDVEASISPGQPIFDVVGLPDIAVQESKARIRPFKSFRLSCPNTARILALLS